MKNGYLSILLHAHLPYVHHPEYPSFFEENWLFQAITESYLPLLAMLGRLETNAIRYKLSLSLSPTLLTMWDNKLLQERYLIYLQNQLSLAEKEWLRNQNEPELRNLALMYINFYTESITSYRDRFDCNLLAGFIKYEELGKLELLTTAATHGFLPLLNTSEIAVRNQIQIGIDTFTAYTHKHPSGFWLPECGYYPGLENHLKAAGIHYFFVDSQGILNADRTPKTAIYAPLNCGNGVMAFGRDPITSTDVWSKEVGYPGDPDYRDYHQDIGFDLDLDYLGPNLLDGKTRISTGIKYLSISNTCEDKKIYAPQLALNKAKQQAAHFIRQREMQINSIIPLMPNQSPIIVAPFDAELFGHWWFEGPIWLEWVLRLSAEQNCQIETITSSDYLKQNILFETATPAASSWGEQSDSSYWLNESNSWIYPLIHKASYEMEKLAADLEGKKLNDIQERALKQAVRSLLLLQSSDWPFILKSGTTVEYAKQRITDNLARFNYLHDSIRKNRINERYLSALEIMDNIFPNVDFRQYQLNVPT